VLGVVETLVRADPNWQGAPGLTRFIPDSMARATALRAGDVDLAQGIPDTALPALAGVSQKTSRPWDVRSSRQFGHRSPVGGGRAARRVLPTRSG
jgi:ABC-type transport system substrate-binding protein